MNAPSTRSLAAAALLFLGGVAVGAAAGFGIARRSPAEIPLMLTGAGASFPYPLYRQWFAAYRDSTGVRIDYYSVGSAGGIQALAQSEIDFGASERRHTPDEISAMPCGQPIAIPTAVGAVALAYHLSPAPACVRLDAATIAAVFDGTIRAWNDPRIQKLNEGIAFPAIPIRVIHRADGSGTTRVFVDFLASHVPAWARRSDNQSVRWPVGTAAIGNSGVASEIQVTPGAIGYVEVSYARQMRLPVAAIRNS